MSLSIDKFISAESMEQRVKADEWPNTYSCPHPAPKLKLKLPLTLSMRHLLNLPPELLILITEFLPIHDILKLKCTCAYLYDQIPRPSHTQLLQAEATEWARHKDIYTCRYCLRLRPAYEFADRMLRRRRSRSGADSDKRFCIECGLKPREGTARYGPGAQVAIQGQVFVICLSCRRFQLGAQDRYGRSTSECLSCWRDHSPRDLYHLHSLEKTLVRFHQ